MREIVALLRWHIDVGADEAIADIPTDWTKVAPRAAQQPPSAAPASPHGRTLPPTPAAPAPSPPPPPAPAPPPRPPPPPAGRPRPSRPRSARPPPEPPPGPWRRKPARLKTCAPRWRLSRDAR